MHTLSVVIVNYNVKPFLEQALISVQKAIQGLDTEVWVVDNNSVDGSVDMVRDKFPWVKCIANKENTGFSRANNQAIRESRSKYVLLLNPDTVLQEDTLHKCVNFMDEHPDCGGLGVRMIDGKGKFLPESKRGLPTPAVAFYKMTGLSAIFPKSRLFGQYHLKFLPEHETHVVDVLSGAYMMLRSECLEKTGLLDEDFFMYGEDIDLSYRITKAGYRNYYFPDTTIIHYKGESTKKRSANYVKVFYNAMVLFARKHYSGKTAGRLNTFIQAAIYLRALLALLWRFVSAITLPLLDFAVIYAGYFGIARYWELYNKYVRDFYPPSYFYLHIPVYILLVLFVAYLSGGYDRPFSVRRLVRGSVAGALGLFAIYAFLPKDMQFSRAILALGCAWAVVAPVLLRYLWQWLRGGGESLDAAARRILVVAGPEEAQRIRELLSGGFVQYAWLGFLHPGNEKPEGFTGNLDQLDEVISIYNVSMVIFSARDVPSQQMMGVMSRYAPQNLHFKIVQENSRFIIGSSSRNTPGELFTVEVRFSITQPEVKRKKRIFDLGVLLLIWLLLPVSLCISAARKMLAYSGRVLLGSHTWVSYQGRPASGHLPALKPGLWFPAEAFTRPELEPEIHTAYARDYNLHRDWMVLWRKWFRKN
ncbi:MAG: glycosyltransferase [Bacteroidetes bacterium]|nr:glycosyltransferase [Bacteroidota bacterium]